LVDASAGDLSGLGPQVQGVVALPPSGDDVYFVAHGVLGDESNQRGELPVAAADNLYVYRLAQDGQPAKLQFVATLPEADAGLWGGGSGIDRANTTSDGRFLVFKTHRGLTADATRAEGPEQVYRYDAVTERLVRVSIGRAGFRDDGNASKHDAQIVPAFQAFQGNAPARSDPTMSDHGDLVFFESPAGLVPGALNEQSVRGNSKVLAENVYEWEAPGAKPSAAAPACEELSGCVALISNGKDITEGSGAHENGSAVQLLGTDSTGENVFFWTADQLVGSDTDSQIDLYDARMEGGFPEAPVEAACGSLPACHGESGPTGPVFGSLASTTFAGPGNITPGQVKPPPPSPKPKTAAQIRAEKLAKALRACRKQRSRTRRAGCEKKTRKTYGKPAKKAGKAQLRRHAR
jgi:hypothetical protein